MTCSSDSPALVWFRADLRLDDNPALRAALETGHPVLPVFILDDAGEGDWAPGGASRWWLHHALADLAQALDAVGLRLILRSGPSTQELDRLIEETNAAAVFWNRRYEPAIIERDQAIKEAVAGRGLDARGFNGALLYEPWEIRNQSGKPFQVFTPYWKHCLARGWPAPVEVELSAARAPTTWPPSLALDEFGLLPTISWDAAFYKAWTPTVAAARQRLGKLAAAGADGYVSHRDRPDMDATSGLSPYLHFGQISPRQVAAAFLRHGSTEARGARKFLSEIGWREFSYHLLYHFPETPTEPLREDFTRFPWERDPALLRAWQRGQTGYPIVDAGMRQLWATGWMHNRVRMVAASLLVKHLLQPWQDGACWFWDTLVDADLASNTQGWQWSAGCGADAAPYFRVFNPVLQGKKFDPAGDYVRAWVPELHGMPDRYLHEPWSAPEGVLRAAGVILGTDYPHPVVEHRHGRNRALQAFEKLKASRAG